MAGRYKLIKVGDDNYVHLPYEEMKQLLDEVYNDGYAEGSKNKYVYWNSPTTTSPYYTTVTCNSDTADSITAHCCCAENEK